MLKKAWQITAVLFGLVIGIVGIASFIGVNRGSNPKGFIHLEPCYDGHQIVVALGTSANIGPSKIHVPDWGPPYFRVKMDALVWPGGAVAYNRNNVGICPDTATEDDLYNAKKNWIDTHNAEWMTLIKTYPEEGKKWYGRQWKSVLRQINRQPKSE